VPWRTGPSSGWTEPPPDLPLGYHEVRPIDGQPAYIVAPGLTFEDSDLGWAVQLYALRSRGWGMGDLADLRQLTEWSRDTLRPARSS
jgi:hypothetical protein